jgi:hypothetical protein
MGIFTAHDTQDAKGGGDGIATGLYSQFDNILRIEVHRVGGEGGAGAVFDALVYGEDREIAGVGKAAMSQEGLEAGEDTIAAIGIHPDLFHVTGRGEGAERGFVEDGLMVEEEGGFVAKEIGYLFGCHGI